VFLLARAAVHSGCATIVAPLCSGLARRPLKAVARVRIPSGLPREPPGQPPGGSSVRGPETVLRQRRRVVDRLGPQPAAPAPRWSDVPRQARSVAPPAGRRGSREAGSYGECRPRADTSQRPATACPGNGSRAVPKTKAHWTSEQPPRRRPDPARPGHRDHARGPVAAAGRDAHLRQISTGQAGCRAAFVGPACRGCCPGSGGCCCPGCWAWPACCACWCWSTSLSLAAAAQTICACSRPG
jgi:hypothetical protein